MSTSLQHPSDGKSNGGNGGRSRSSKQRPSPLVFPRDRAYGTVGDGNGEGGSTAGRGSTRQSGLLLNSVTSRRFSIDSMPLWSNAASPIIRTREHCHQQWVAVLFTMVLLVITFYFVFGLSGRMRAEQCATPFGSMLGENSGVAAYSNCRNEYRDDGMEHFVSVGLQRLYTGSQWQALEYARRYWILTSLLTFPSLPAADHMLRTDTASVVNGRRDGRGSSTVLLERYTNLFLPSVLVQNRSKGILWMKLNGEANNLSTSAQLMNSRRALLQPLDIVVYARNPHTLPFGHVAVVTAVHGPYHSVAEAGKEVRWFLVKNASAQGRQPMAPGSQLPRQLLSQQSGLVGNSVAQLQDTAGNSAAGSSASIRCAHASVKESAEGEASNCSVLYYKVFIVEQNWDNAFWETLRYLTDADFHNNATGNSQSTPKEAPDEQQQQQKGAARPRDYTRVLLLHEYLSPQGFFLEDTHNNLILGWVRAPSDA
ncbi:hypothetical protein LSCM1_02796 [Leishmania martiniquensis]|uniref:D-alanyl-glycyl endopeptidase-like protein n=1 Tax=Leishmania martiniquensis TaxID=1580590 RepID=A0A836H2B2_9TRYP|nr:hypothetical protein LSCM1_02796 [Leishmania martiniquensis]